MIIVIAQVSQQIQLRLDLVEIQWALRLRLASRLLRLLVLLLLLLLLQGS